MQRLTPRKRVLFACTPKLALLGVLSVVLFSACIVIKSTPATAATISTVNFQARLMNASGSIVPDGNYNIQFKLYDASSGGTNLWTESYTSTSGPGSSDVRVRVANGYLSVALGSITSFPGSIDWSQDLYLTMNIGGTGTGSFPGIGDGEMSPRIHLTAVPYAFKAGQAVQLASGNSTLSFTNPSNSNAITLPDASGVVCLQGSSSCNFAAASGSSSYIQNGTTVQTGANFNIQTGNIANATATLKVLASQTANVLEIQDSAGGTIAGISSNGTIFSAPSGTTIPSTARLFIQPLSASSSAIVARAPTSATADILKLQNSTGATDLFTVGPAGATKIQTTTDNTNAFQVLTSTGTKILGVDTVNNFVRISAGTINNSTLTSGTGALQIGADNTDNLVLDDNEIMARSNGGTNTLYVQKLGGGLQIQAATTVIKPSTDSTTALQVQKSSDSSVIFNVDTTNKRVGIGIASPTRTLDISGELNVTGLQPASVAGTGTTATSSSIAGGKGGNTSGTTGQTGGGGAAISILGGDGGNASTGSTNGAGGSVTLRGGAAGSGTGSGNFRGNVILQDAGGYVGVGTASPNAFLHVSGSDGLASDLVRVTDSTTSAMDVFRIFDEGATLHRTRTNSVTGFQVQNAGGTAVLNVDTSNGRVGIGNAAPGYPLDVTGQINSTTGFSINGTLICSSSTCAPASGSGFYIRNQTTLQTSASFFVQGGSGNVTGVLQANGADILDLKNSSGTNVATFGSTGNVLIKPSTNSATAFQIQPAASSASIFIVDTSLGRIGINDDTPDYALDVNGDINSDTAVRVGGITVCTSSCIPSSGSNNYIQNSTTVQTSANFSVRSSATNAVTGILQGANGQTSDILQVQSWNGTSATNLATIGNTGNALFRTTSDDANAFRVQDTAGATMFTVDSSNNYILVGSTTTNSTAVLLVMDSYNQSSDPTGVNGAMYYSSYSNSFRCYAGGSWQPCSDGALHTKTGLVGGDVLAPNSTSTVTFAESYTIPANGCTPGRNFKLTARGYYSTMPGGAPLTMGVKLGSTTVGTIGPINMPPSAVRLGWDLIVEFQCYATNPNVNGLINANGAFTYTAANAGGSLRLGGGFPNDQTAIGNVNYFTIDTTSSQAITVNTTWGTANLANSVTMTQFTVEARGH